MILFLSLAALFFLREQIVLFCPPPLSGHDFGGPGLFRVLAPVSEGYLGGPRLGRLFGPLLRKGHLGGTRRVGVFDPPPFSGTPFCGPGLVLLFAPLSQDTLGGPSLSRAFSPLRPGAPLGGSSWAGCFNPPPF